ncbi:MAG: DUF423 domain-containing protein [Sphingomonas sanxanigenens]|uniref:DUF423 domain-containing protein n=1 Tax=Sphingomonas sanxanigenens TaxID=397260 RepID=A0A2W5AB50_9SPHN|nr:MAG: DUF423 domain-containing protein [Sphingomonas sanxanigenens]
MRRGDTQARLAALSAAIAVGAGAYAAHGAAGQAADWLRTGAFYQLVHAVAVIAVAGRWRGSAWLLLGGATIFAGTLYAMAFSAPHWLGAITPIGGAGMILGWILVALSGR